MAQKKTDPKPDLDLGVPGLAGFVTALNPVASKALFEMMSESTEFMTERLNSTVALQQQMMTCTSPAEMMELQSAYAKETMVAWSAELQRCATLMTSSMSDIAKDAKDGHKRAYNDVPV